MYIESVSDQEKVPFNPLSDLEVSRTTTVPHLLLRPLFYPDSLPVDGRVVNRTVYMVTTKCTQLSCSSSYGPEVGGNIMRWSHGKRSPCSTRQFCDSVPPPSLPSNLGYSLLMSPLFKGTSGSFLGMDAGYSRVVNLQRYTSSCSSRVTVPGLYIDRDVLLLTWEWISVSFIETTKGKRDLCIFQP